MEMLLDILFRHNQKTITICTIVLVVLITLSFANSTLLILDEVTRSAAPVTGTETVAVVTSQNNSPSIASLANFNLFGVVAAEPEQVQVEAPETKLNLELQGVFTADEDDLSTAIVAEKNKDGLLYKIGDQLPGKAVLNAVFDSYILMKRGNQFERLSFSDDAYRAVAGGGDENLTLAERRSAVRTRALNATREEVEERQATSRRSIQEAASREDIAPPPRSDGSIGDFIRNNRDKIQSDPQSLLSDLGIQAVEAGAANGYKVDGSIPNDLLQKAGLRQGDVILSVNGRPVGNAMNDTELVDTAVASGRVRVEVQRDSRRFFVTVPVK